MALREQRFFCDVFLRIKHWRLKMSADTGHTFIVGSLEKGRCESQDTHAMVSVGVFGLQSFVQEN